MSLTLVVGPPRPNMSKDRNLANIDLLVLHTLHVRMGSTKIAINAMGCGMKEVFDYARLIWWMPCRNKHG